MAYNALQDLVLAGVRWELVDDMMNATSTGTTSTPIEKNTNPADTGRFASAVVPPIAPTQTISQDTANAMAARPMDIDALCRMIGEFNHPLRSGATNTVLPHIAHAPNGLLIISDIPSSDDDATGQILTGGAGELMDKMLAAIGMSRENVSITPMLFWRTPGGRSPSTDEINLARPFVNRIIELLKPRVILTMGTLPATEIAGVNLVKSHGGETTHESGAICVPIFHPNYLILKPAAKRDVWNALQNVQNILKNH